MAAAIILSGGTGTRLGLNGIPKQYIKLDGVPIILHAMRPFLKSKKIETVVIVADPIWQSKIDGWIAPDPNSQKIAFAKSGNTRQESILNGLKRIGSSFVPKDDLVIIHDAARPFINEKLINHIFSEFKMSDCQGILPVVPINDTVYYSEDSESIGALLDRDVIYAGQAPELMVFSQYLQICNEADEAELQRVRGTSEIAYNNGMTVRLIAGDEENFKVTTASDLRRACEVLGCDFDDVIIQNNLKARDFQ